MKRSSSETEERLHRFLGRYGNPPESQVETEIERAWQELHTKDPLPEIGSSRWFPRLAIAAAFVAVVAGATVAVRNSFWTSGSHAVVETAGRRLPPSDSIPFGKAVRSGGDVTALVLPDGSRIEMRPNSELVLENAKDGVRIRLNVGSVIVTAAEQRTGHLYVQTKDLTVSVVGTVFMVNAREEGSRVAVIQGEVHVRQGETLKTLLPGDQVATGISMQALPVAAEISWSRKAPEHLALLQENIAVRTEAPSVQTFAAAVVKPHDPRVPLFDAGFGCRGVDGKRMAPFGESGEPGIVVPKGKCVGTGVLFPQLVAFAFGLPQKYGPNVPDWAVAGTPTDVTNTDPATGQTLTIRRFVPQRFQINAIAEDPSSATADQLRRMVQTLLTERFRLEAHRETLEVPGYALSLASTPAKLKERAGDETRLVADFSTDRPMLRGSSTIDEFMMFLMGFANPTGYVDGALPSYIVNKTGLGGIYEWEFALPTPTNIGGVSDPGPMIVQPSAIQKNAWRGPAMAAAVEKQLGLRMQPQQVPVEVLVIDSVEKPSPN